MRTPENITEQDLASGCRQANNTCRQVLYQRYAPKMMALCYRYTGDRSTSEDLLHDGFIRVFERINKFHYRGEGSLQAWLKSLFTHLVLDYLNENRRTVILSTDEIEEEPEEWHEHRPEEIPAEQLMQFVGRLPEGYRTVFNLYVMEEWSHKEIARHLRIAESSSRSQLARAKQLLAQQVKTYINEQ